MKVKCRIKKCKVSQDLATIAVYSKILSSSEQLLVVTLSSFFYSWNTIRPLRDKTQLKNTYDKFEFSLDVG